MPYVAGGIVTWIVLVLGVIAAWLTHIVVCIKTASWILLIIGALAFPIGIIHGVMVWLGLV